MKLVIWLKQTTNIQRISLNDWPLVCRINIKIIDGLKREIKEELEIDVNIGDPFAVFDYTNEVKGSHSIEVIYFATLSGKPEDITLHEDDHSDCGWFAEDELGKIANPRKGMDNPEFVAIKKAFALLKGDRLDFATE